MQRLHGEIHLYQCGTPLKTTEEEALHWALAVYMHVAHKMTVSELEKMILRLRAVADMASDTIAAKKLGLI